MAFILDQNQVCRSSILSSVPWVSHGFGTAAGSPVTGAFHASLHQTHSDRVLCIDRPGEKQEDGDGLITQTPGLSISIRTADCLPILLIDTQNRAVAAIHAGWRGTAAGIAQKTVAKMVEKFGSSPSALFAAIGPGIGECCFEVGDEVALHFAAFATAHKQGKFHVDLKTANLKQLVSCGLAEENVDVCSYCTVSSPGFHSFRRDRSEGRMTSAVQIILETAVGSCSRIYSSI